MTHTMTTIGTDQDLSRAWRSHLLALGVVLALILVEFIGAILAAIEVWKVSPTYSHCFLILPIVGWLIWEKKDVLQRIRPAVEPRILLLIVPLLALWWLGELSAVNEVRQYAVVGMMQTVIIALLGPQVVRQIWFPVLFLLALVPTGEYLIGPMQQFAARFVDISLNLLKIPHYTEGTVIEMTNGRFEIAEACAGLRFLIATVTLGVLFAYLVYRSITKIGLFLIASVIIPLIGNGLRCVGIILLAHYTDNKYGAGADHIVYGWGFNVTILLILMFIGSLFRDEPRDSSPGAAPVAGRPDAGMSIIAVATMAGVLISAGPAWALWRDHAGVVLDRNVIQTALQSSGWRASEPGGNWHPYFPQADARFLEERDVIEPVNLFIGYYARPRAGRTVTAHFNKPWDDEFGMPLAAPRSKLKLGTAVRGIERIRHRLRVGEAASLVHLLGGRHHHEQPATCQVASGEGGSEWPRRTGRYRSVHAAGCPYRRCPDPSEQGAVFSRSALRGATQRGDGADQRPREPADVCGIAGWFDLGGQRPPDQKMVRRMTDAISHRGPDGEGFHFEPGLGFGHRRLAVIDLVTGDQPMHSGDGSATLIFNGEIFNFRELRQELEQRGHVFGTHSDTEVILEAWLEWGPDCVTRLTGMFAFALWDRRSESLFLARDRLGEKPLYYAILPDQGLVFCSEMKKGLTVCLYAWTGRLKSSCAVEDFLCARLYSRTAHHLLQYRAAAGGLDFAAASRPEDFFAALLGCNAVHDRQSRNGASGRGPAGTPGKDRQGTACGGRSSGQLPVGRSGFQRYHRADGIALPRPHQCLHDRVQ